MAKLFLESTDTRATVSDNNVSVYGASNDQVVVINGSLTGVVLDSNVERVQFTGSTTDYKYVQAGTDLKVYNATGDLVSTIGLQDDTTGTQLTFANGTVKAAIVAPTATAPMSFSIGGTAVTAVATTAAPTPTPAAVTIASTAIDTSLASALLPSFSVAGAASATEGSSALFTVTLANPSATTATTVKYALTGLNAATTSADYGDEVVAGTNVTADYNATLPIGTLTFAPGATTATITVPVTFDSAIETGEGVTLTLSLPSAGTVSSTGASVTTAFADAPAPTFTMTSSAVAGISTQEGRTITFTVTPSGVVNASTVLNLNMVGATFGAIAATTNAADFTTASPLTFAAGSTAAQTITVTVVADGTVEGIEAYKAQLLDSSFNEKAAIQGTVADPTPTVTLTVSPASVNEGAAVVYTATSDMAAPAGGLSVPYTLSGTATNATDYTGSVATTGTISIAAGLTTGTLTLNAIADNLTEGAETIIATLGSVSGATVITTPVTTTINDTSLALAATDISLSAIATVNEGGTITYTVTRGAASATAVTVPYTLTGTATNLTDYTGSAATTGTITIAANATTGTLVLTTLADTLTEGAETVIMTLGTPSAGAVATGLGTVTTTIADTSVAVAGSNFSLTVANDNLTGTAGNDTFDGGLFFNTPSGTYVQTLSNNDSVDAGAGVDTMNVTFTTAATYTPLALRNLEVINLTNQGVAGVLDLSNATGVTTLSNVGSSTNLADFRNVQSTVTTFNLTNTAVGLRADIANSALSGATDAATLNISNVTAAVVTLQTVSAASGYETLNVVSSGSTANVLTILTDGNGTSLATINVSGTNNINLGSALDTTVTTVNASTFTGNLTVDASGVANVTVTGGTGNDTLTFGAGYTTADSINGGAGTDILSVTTAMLGGISTTQSNVSNIETLSVSNANVASTYTVSAWGATNLVLTTAASNIAMTYNYASGTAGLSYGAVIDTAVQTVNSAGTATTDVLNLTIGTSSAGVLETSETATTGFETININARGGVDSLGAITMTATASTETINITGAVALTLGIVTADKLDASAFTGALTMVTGTTAAGGIAITGGTAADALFGAAAADVIGGGNGDDTITGFGGADILTGGAGFDTFRFSTSIVSAASYATDPNITDFTVGSTAALSDKFGISQANTDFSAGNGLATGGGAAGTLVASAAGAALTVVQTIAQNASSAAIGATADFLKLTTGVVAAGSNQFTFDAAIGTAVITGITAATSMAGSFYDTTNSKAVIFEVLSTAPNTTQIEATDVIKVIGTINMTATDYSTFGANQLEFF